MTGSACSFARSAPRRPLRRAAFAGIVAVVAAVAAQAAPADIVRSRVTGYRELGAAFKNVNDELRSATPQAMVLQLSARQIRDVARQQYEWFPAGSGPQAGVKTGAKADIWARPAEFKAAQDAFAAQANAFTRLAAAGDVPKMRVAAKALGQTCAACHRGFRVEERR